jgi:hypothetical protein
VETELFIETFSLFLSGFVNILYSPLLLNNVLLVVDIDLSTFYFLWRSINDFTSSLNNKVFILEADLSPPSSVFDVGVQSSSDHFLSVTTG